MNRIATKDWYFYPHIQEIQYVKGGSVMLPRRLSKCLECLILSDGNVLEYDELLKLVWNTEFREPSTITSAISELRKVINCNNEKQYIKTISKKGYMFIGEFVLEECCQENEFIRKKTSYLSLIHNVGLSLNVRKLFFLLFFIFVLII